MSLIHGVYLYTVIPYFVTSKAYTQMVELNSTPEVLLRKRKNADRVRLEKQEQVRKREEEQRRKKNQRKDKFIRAESLVAKTLATRRELERVKRVTKTERQTLSEATNKHYISKVSSDGSKTKQIYSGKPTLYFIVRTPGPHGVKIPSKVQKILSLLRLNRVNTGVFVKLTETIYPLLKLISPYTVIGQPSLATVRQLIQKRATVTLKVEENDENKKTIKLNDNNLVEEKLGDEGIICIEDIIHEIVSLSDNFKKVTHFLDPFVLNNDIVGYGPLAKLKKMEKQEEKKQTKVSNAGSAPILEIDIDDFISQLN